MGQENTDRSLILQYFAASRLGSNNLIKTAHGLKEDHLEATAQMSVTIANINFVARNVLPLRQFNRRLLRSSGGESDHIIVVCFVSTPSKDQD
jgi:hypothetical protein